MTSADCLQKLLESRHGERLQLGTARLASTGEPVAVVVTVDEAAPDARQPVALGMLRPARENLLDQYGALTDAARDVFEALKDQVFNADNEAWFSEDLSGHVYVGFAKPGALLEDHTALLALPWKDPAVLFEATALDH